jgi:hypothetical protein
MKSQRFSYLAELPTSQRLLRLHARSRIVRAIVIGTLDAPQRVER